MIAPRRSEKRVALVTGSTDGLGRALALRLAEEGWRLIVHGRDNGRCRETVRALEQAGGTAPDHFRADFSSLRETIDFADSVARATPRLDLLVNNAGIGIAAGRAVSEDGFERTFQVNYIAGALLTRRLLPLLAASAPARVINVTSAGQYRIDFGDLQMERRWNGAIAYGRSKLAQIMDVRSLAGSVPPTDVVFQAIHPASLMRTKLVTGIPRPANALKRYIFNKVMAPRRDVNEGVDSIMRLLGEEELRYQSGRYFNFYGSRRAHKQADDDRARGRLQQFIESTMAPLLDNTEMKVT